jgi:hypothetical protein
MADSPASASSLDLIPISALEEAEEEIPSAPATSDTGRALVFRDAIDLLDAQMSEEKDGELPEFAGEDERDAPGRHPIGQWRAWPLEEQHPTVFDFGRWAWIALYDQGEFITQQLYILGGYPDHELAAQWLEEDLAEVRSAMLEHNAMVDHGITIEQWEELAESKKDEALAWLEKLRLEDEEHRSYWRYPVENEQLGLSTYKIFNVSSARDRQEAREWAWQVHRAVLFAAHHPSRPQEFRFPAPALFDVGPGGTEGEVWQLRQFGIFEGLRGLKFSRLPGNAMLVDFVRDIHAWIDEEDLQVLRSLPENKWTW